MRNEPGKNPRVNDEQDPMDEKPEQTLMVGTNKNRCNQKIIRITFITVHYHGVALTPYVRVR